MKTVKVFWLDNGKERCLYIGGPEEFISYVYAAANEVHIPIGPGAFDCKFEELPVINFIEGENKS